MRHPQDSSPPLKTFLFTSDTARPYLRLEDNRAAALAPVGRAGYSILMYRLP